MSETKTVEVPRRLGSPVGQISRCKMHYNWDGFTTWCGRKVEPPLKLTGFGIYVTCKACLRAARLEITSDPTTASQEKP